MVHFHIKWSKLTFHWLHEHQAKGLSNPLSSQMEAAPDCCCKGVSDIPVADQAHSPAGPFRTAPMIDGAAPPEPYLAQFVLTTLHNRWYHSEAPHQLTMALEGEALEVLDRLLGKCQKSRLQRMEAVRNQLCKMHALVRTSVCSLRIWEIACTGPTQALSRRSWSSIFVWLTLVSLTLAVVET